MQNKPHRFYEDVLAIVCAAVFVSLGVEIFLVHQLIAGGTAGIGLVSSNLFPVSFGLIFFLVNLPFYYLAWTQLGKRFATNTFISVTLVSFLSEHMSSVITFGDIHPIFASVMGGMLIGVGLLIMFRHKSSLGGIGILGYYLQNRNIIRAGTLQIIVDSVILTVALIVFPLPLVLLSILAALTTNILLAVNHKPGRYQADLEVATRENVPESETFIDDSAELESKSSTT